MSIVVLSNQGKDERSLKEGAEQCVRLYAQPAIDVEPGQTIPIGQHVNLQLQAEGQKIFQLEINKSCQSGLFTQHTADEFDIKLSKLSPKLNDSSIQIQCLSTTVERIWVTEHEHDDEVGSIAIERSGNVDPEKLNQWMGKLLAEKGVDIFRTKGFISYEGESRRIVFQGVHMLFTAQPDREWGDDPRHNQLVFIGRNLDESAMREGFEQCLI
jgi:G3E family GTPase